MAGAALLPWNVSSSGFPPLVARNSNSCQPRVDRDFCNRYMMIEIPAMLLMISRKFTYTPNEEHDHGPQANSKTTK